MITKPNLIAISLIISTSSLLSICHGESATPTTKKTLKRVNLDSPIYTIKTTSQSTPSKGTLLGVFNKIEIGDYYHVTITDTKNVPHSFFLSPEIDQQIIDSLEDNPKLVGKKVRINWERRNQKLLEASSSINLDYVTNIEFIR